MRITFSVAMIFLTIVACGLLYLNATASNRVCYIAAESKIIDRFVWDLPASKSASEDEKNLNHILNSDGRSFRAHGDMFAVVIVQSLLSIGLLGQVTRALRVHNWTISFALLDVLVIGMLVWYLRHLAPNPYHQYDWHKLHSACLAFSLAIIIMELNRRILLQKNSIHRDSKNKEYSGPGS